MDSQGINSNNEFYKTFDEVSVNMRKRQGMFSGCIKIMGPTGLQTKFSSS